MLKHGLTPVISQFNQLDILKSAMNSEQKVKVHLKINTGMYRLGMDMVEIPEAAKWFASQPNLKLVGLCTHLATTEDFYRKDGFTQIQLSRFKDALSVFPNFKGHVHIFNSAGLIAQTLSKVSAFGVRPGISLYGIKPDLLDLPKELAGAYADISLKPVMTLKSQIIAYHLLETGETVSYGQNWRAKSKSVVGVIPIGYADGYQRILSNRGLMLFRGQLVPVVGTVCMDYVLVDLTSVLGFCEGRIGEEVVLFGEQQGQHLSVEDIAERANTISYELLAGIGKRVPRQYVA